MRLKIIALVGLLELLLPYFSAQGAENRNGIAVIIGNQTYQGTIPPVDYAINDAEAIRRYVIDVLGYREGNIIDLRNATKGQFDATFGTNVSHEGKLFDWMKAGKSDVTVFYSGHGVPGLKDKRGYLLPVDGDANRAEITGYSLDLMYKNLGLLPARSVTVYLDTCFSGESNAGMVVKGTSGISVTPKRAKASSKLTILTAASSDQVASWDKESEQGLFTEYLLRALYGAADSNKDGQVTLAETREYLNDEMSYQAKRLYGRKQTPTIRGDEGTVLIAYSGANLPVRPVLDGVSTAAVLNTGNIAATSTGKFGKFSFSATPTKKLFRYGDKITFSLKASRDFSLKIYYVDGNGNYLQFFPNAVTQRNYFRSGGSFTFPSDSDPFQLDVSAPFGVEKFVFVAAAGTKVAYSSMDKVNSSTLGRTKAVNLNMNPGNENSPSAQVVELVVKALTGP